MKKIICLIFVLILSAVSVLSLGGCGETEENNDVGKKEVYTPTVVEGKYIVKDGVSDYKIVIPSGCESRVITASNELQLFFSEATGVLLPIVTDDGILENGKYFSLSKTKLVKDGKDFDVSSLSENSYKILTEDDDIFVLSDGEDGVLWGVYKLLNFLFGYRYYTADVYKLDKGVATKSLIDIDFTDIPDIEIRIGGGANTYNKKAIDVLRYKYTTMTEILCGGYHNSLSLIDPAIYNNKEDEEHYHPSWFSGGGKQLCYTAHGDEAEYEEMLQTIYETMLDKLLNERPDAKYVSLMIEDNWETCTCDACQASAAKYNDSRSAAIIQFCNKVYQKLHGYFVDNNIDRDVKVVYFAYYGYEDVPAKLVDGKYEPIDDSVVCKGVVPYYANLSTCVHNKDYSEPENKACLELLNKLEAICNDYWIWGYCVNFSNYVAPYDYFNTVQKNFEMLKDTSCSLFFLQGGWNAGTETRFGRLIEFLISEMTWDASQNVDELTKEFFDNCYGPASETMMKYYDEMRIRLQYIHNVLGVSNSVFLETIMGQDYWPLSLLSNWEEMIDKAYGEIEYLKDFDTDLYNKYLENIKVESLFVRYFKASIYMTGSSTVNQQYKKSLVSDMRELGMLKVSESKTVEQVANDWNIN